MQQSDLRGARLDIEPMRKIIRTARELQAGSLLDIAADTLTRTARMWLNRAARLLRSVYADPAEVARSDEWDVRVLGLVPDTITGLKTEPVNFSGIRQGWLRNLAKLWVSTGAISRIDSIRGFISITSTLSDAIALGPAHSDPTRLSRLEITKLVSLVKGCGLSRGTCRRRLGHLDSFLHHARSEGWLDDVPGGFAIRDVDLKSFRAKGRSDEDRAEDAVPEHIIQQLNAQTHLLRGSGRGSVPAELNTRMRRLLYILLRDTGRRCSDLSSLRNECVVRDGDGWSLRYDNVKAKRLGRLLPIEDETAREVQEVAAMVAANYPTTPPQTLPLFPRSIQNATGQKGVSPNGLADWIDTWVDAVPSLLNDYADADGKVGQFDRTKIHPHAFRHAYAQRHADAGVRQDVLAELLDHESIEPTRGYYFVTRKQRREAIEIEAAHRVDRLGNPVSRVSGLAYERQSVAVPYGSCMEPSNVQAGGQACPIRYQCSGCMHFRADPSHLPSIETHIHELLQNREDAIAIEAADWVVEGIENEIAAYRHIAFKMKEDLSSLTEEEHAAVEKASAILRRSRGAGSGTSTAGPVRITIGRRPQEDTR
ncbi:tyrosine-type recombinase/integrase [Microbacterium sp. KSW4-16]|uniref:tyrosine-type recombinase/integrase n=1 Tax=Microbacterium aurugineum TaxID=2851642 RepID=UPI0020C1495D|nr:tyrosine-type recombinase/integrase [Microbacterium aurugineum]MCK8468261.1 tyrosine-type recombinase/integrase [Microbacterium aurugineum]